MDECELCGGSGEVSISKDGTAEGTDYYGCPACIARDRDDEIAKLKEERTEWIKTAALASTEIDKLVQQRDELIAALEFCSGSSYLDDVHREADEALFILNSTLTHP
jgi:hypothetical protein